MLAIVNASKFFVHKLHADKFAVNAISISYFTF